jgi:hypothetical protein
MEMSPMDLAALVSPSVPEVLWPAVQSGQLDGQVVGHLLFPSPDLDFLVAILLKDSAHVLVRLMPSHLSKPALKLLSRVSESVLPRNPGLEDYANLRQSEILSRLLMPLVLTTVELAIGCSLLTTMPTQTLINSKFWDSVLKSVICAGNVRLAEALVSHTSKDMSVSKNLSHCELSRLESAIERTSSWLTDQQRTTLPIAPSLTPAMKRTRHIVSSSVAPDLDPVWEHKEDGPMSKKSRFSCRPDPTSGPSSMPTAVLTSAITAESPLPWPSAKKNEISKLSLSGCTEIRVLGNPDSHTIE